jgi:ubiquinone/menaquinone biosynthesis C-methylase UbiE
MPIWGIGPVEHIEARLRMRSHPDRDEFNRLWVQEYSSQNYNRGLAAHVLRESHKVIERSFGRDVCFKEVLELGSGDGMHLDFVTHQYVNYLLTDESHAMLNRARQRHKDNARVKFRTMDARKIDLPSNSIDRIVAVHVLEHLTDPHLVLAEWNRVLRTGGVLSIILPSDPGIAWRLGRLLGPRSKWKRLGVFYDYWMAREHVNSIFNLRTLIRYYFEYVDEYWYPFRIPAADLNLIYGCNIKINCK